jgi:hypothetical protein
MGPPGGFLHSGIGYLEYSSRVADSQRLAGFSAGREGGWNVGTVEENRYNAAYDLRSPLSAVHVRLPAPPG